MGFFPLEQEHVRFVRLLILEVTSVDGGVLEKTNSKFCLAVLYPLLRLWVSSLHANEGKYQFPSVPNLFC